MFVNGRVRGHISGVVDANIHGVIKGDFAAMVDSGNITVSDQDEVRALNDADDAADTDTPPDDINGTYAENTDNPNSANGTDSTDSTDSTNSTDNTGSTDNIEKEGE